MNINEYNHVKDFDYSQYCDYLQEKYGIGLSDFFTRNWNPKPKCKRTEEGLLAHHKFEDRVSKLSDKDIARSYPFEWQAPENIVYCDYLEHLLLHILICESKLENPSEGEIVGVGGIIQYIIPELNDVYSGWKTAQKWRTVCHSKIINDKDVYLLLLKRFLTNCYLYPYCDTKYLLSSCNAQYGLWEKENNRKIFDEILAL